MLPAYPDLRIERGTLTDYRRLAEHHYRPGEPAAIDAVYVVRRPGPTIGTRVRRLRRGAGRAGRTSAAGPGEPVAVAVLSLPQLACRLRDYATRGRFGSALPPAARAARVNREVRCISRVIVEPRYRGLGLAVRLVRHAIAANPAPYTEALAAMGRIHPFFERAGMTPHERPPHPGEARLLDTLDHLGLDRAALRCGRPALQRIDRLTPPERHLLARELNRWTPPGSPRLGSAADVPAPELLTRCRLAAARALFRPMYFLHWKGGNATAR